MEVTILEETKDPVVSFPFSTVPSRGTDDALLNCGGASQTLKIRSRCTGLGVVFLIR